ncbi:B-cell scaffold protein with ankyrin repeats isoform X2 [Erinaceus europaeus]|uniref:B-cell scaffold protein with ankyrin repeats isoform X2 n=1 Tax=Erinaceus europaeus TaxID=9365 RepID=A0ABM3WTE1_ERIEU|nr:B-cell scaffold protein with ankyrin repeats isoform X2 [Erinaceus europaeus]
MLPTAWPRPSPVYGRGQASPGAVSVNFPSPSVSQIQGAIRDIEQLDTGHTEGFTLAPALTPGDNSQPGSLQTSTQPEGSWTPWPGAEGAQDPGGPSQGLDGSPQAQLPVPSPCGESPQEPEEDDLYVFIPGEPENHVQTPDSRPPLPPPRPGGWASQGQTPSPASGTVAGAPVKSGPLGCVPGECAGAGGEEAPPERLEDPYTFAEVEDSDYDLILSHSDRPASGRPSITHRPPAPAPRPLHSPPRVDTTPYIAQVFQHKAARRPSNGDKPPCPRRTDRPLAGTRGCLDAGQEHLIQLQQRVKNGALSLDQALEQFRRWQRGKHLEVLQQEKLRQLRDCVIGKREEENLCEKLTILHHTRGQEGSLDPEHSLHGGVLAGSKDRKKLRGRGDREGERQRDTRCPAPPLGKLSPLQPPARLPAERQWGFCQRKTH